MHYCGKPMKFEDCVVHGRGSGSELFIVEGDSAAAAVANIRSVQTQAVLPMQGKPLNALRANGQRVAEFPLFKQLVTALGVSLTDLDTGEVSDALSSRFDRVLLLFDPDADGIHCGALMLMFFYRWMRPLLEHEMVYMVRPPLFLISYDGGDAPIHAYSPEHAGRVMSELKRLGKTNLSTHHHRGLASIDPLLLASACVDPVTRKADVMRTEEADEAIAVFSTEKP